MEKAYNKAVQLLKIRLHHSEELRKKLSLRGFNRDDVDAVIQKLVQENLIDNVQFAQAYLGELIRNKTFGFYGMKAKLMMRGIPSNEAEKLLRENFSLELEKEIVLRVVDRNKNLDKLKLAQKLSRKGFRSEIIQQVIK